MQSSSSTNNSIEQAISFLTTPLSRTTVAASAITILQAHLYGSLTQLSTATNSRSFKVGLRLASSTPPPECIARACDASGVNWSEWLFLIGGGMGLDLDVSITPNAVTASFSRAGTPSLGLVTVWQREEPQMTSRELLYADDDSEDLFNEINRSQHSPSWLSSWSMNVAPSRASALTAPVAVPKMGPVPLSARSHSRSSSYASTNSSSSHSHHSHSGNSPYNAHANTFGNYNMGGGGSSSGSNASGSPPNSVYSLSEDGSSGSSGGNMSWTRRGTVVPGPQQSAIMAARNAHAHAQTYPPVPAINVDHPQGQHRTSPSISSASSVTSGSSNGKHRRQRSTTQAPVVVIDPSKASVTAYDGGKTKVMTGGVMLGSVNSGKREATEPCSLPFPCPFMHFLVSSSRLIIDFIDCTFITIILIFLTLVALRELRPFTPRTSTMPPTTTLYLSYIRPLAVPSHLILLLTRWHSSMVNTFSPQNSNLRHPTFDHLIPLVLSLRFLP